MTSPVLTFFNNKGGVGKTSLAYHVAWMIAEMGGTVVAVDLDPQANLTSAFLPEETLESLWSDDISDPHARTIHECVKPLTEGGDIRPPQTIEIADRLHIIPGDLALAGFEDVLSREWPNSLGSTDLYRPFRILSAFWLLAQMAAEQHHADVVLADVGPNLGAINRSALIGADHVVIPLAADIFSLQSLRNLGPTLQAWRADWRKRIDNWNAAEFALPPGTMNPAGYVLRQQTERLERPLKPSAQWANRIPGEYRTHVLNAPSESPPAIEMDPLCLARLKNYRSLVEMARDVSKPIFKLTPADGAIGSHSYAVGQARSDFQKLTETILDRIGIELPGKRRIAPPPQL